MFMRNKAQEYKLHRISHWDTFTHNMSRPQAPWTRKEMGSLSIWALRVIIPTRVDILIFVYMVCQPTQFSFVPLSTDLNTKLESHDFL